MRRVRLIDESEEIAFAVKLRARVANACAREPGLRAKLSKELKWPNLSRLDAYASGRHFPSPSSLKSIAGVLGDDWLNLAAEAGYLREVVDALDAISEYDDSADREGHRRRGAPEALLDGPAPRWICAAYVRSRFGDQDELSTQEAEAARIAYTRALGHIVIASLAEKAQAALDGRHRPHRLIRFTKDVLAMSEIAPRARVAIASTFMRAWADILDPQGKATT